MIKIRIMINSVVITVRVVIWVIPCIVINIVVCIVINTIIDRINY